MLLGIPFIQEYPVQHSLFLRRPRFRAPFPHTDGQLGFGRSPCEWNEVYLFNIEYKEWIY